MLDFLRIGRIQYPGISPLQSSTWTQALLRNMVGLDSTVLPNHPVEEPVEQNGTSSNGSADAPYVRFENGEILLGC